MFFDSNSSKNVYLTDNHLNTFDIWFLLSMIFFFQEIKNLLMNSLHYLHRNVDWQRRENGQLELIKFSFWGFFLICWVRLLFGKEKYRNSMWKMWRFVFRQYVNLWDYSLHIKWRNNLMIFWRKLKLFWLLKMLSLLSLIHAKTQLKMHGIFSSVVNLKDHRK